MSAPPKTSNLSRYGGRILGAGVAIGVTYAYFATRAPKPAGTPGPNLLRTPGVKNIEKAYQSGGATSTHTKAYGGTELGQRSDVERQHAGPGSSGTGKPKGFGEEGIGEEQRPVQPNGVGAAWNDMKYGTKGGK